MTDSMWLAQWMARAGALSRRKAIDAIKTGRVQVNDETVVEPATKVSDADIVLLDGQLVEAVSTLHAFKYYKPRGIVSTLSDEHGRRDLSEVIRTLPKGCVPIGRLDRESEGLILFTNAGDWVQKLSHPLYGHEKVYRISIHSTVSDQQVRRLETMATVDNDRLRYRAKVRVSDQGRQRTRLEITLREGKNRQIRKMCAAVGLDVARLVRVAQCGISAKGLAVGACHPLSRQEVARLREAVEAS